MKWCPYTYISDYIHFLQVAITTPKEGHEVIPI